MCDQKLALITGASRGIGAEVARQLAKNGCDCILVCRERAAELESVAASLLTEGVNVEPFLCDVSSPDGVAELMRSIENRFGRLPDILVNNAGIARSGVLADMTDGDYEQIFSVNMRGVFLTCRAVYDSMVANRWGRIVNISSMWGICGASCEVLYSASKAAVIGFTKALALELAPSGITVNAVAPGVIRTEMLDCYNEETLNSLAEETPAGRLGTPQDIASAVAYLCREESAFVTGQVLSVNGGFIT